MRRQLIPTTVRLGDERGFTLIEILIAAVILVVGIGALLGLFINSGKGSETSSRQDTAAAVATQALESMRSYPYASLHLNGAVSSLPDGRLINPTTFQATTSSTDTLDSTTPPACTTGYTTACSPFAPISSGSIGATPYTLYRVISYDSQSCPLGTLSASTVSDLSSDLSALYGDVNGVEGLLGTLAGTGANSITAAVNHLLGLVGTLLDAGTLKNDLNTLSATVGSSATGLEGMLAPVYSSLQNLQSQGYLTTSGLTSTATSKLGNLNLCQLIDTTTNGVTQGLLPTLGGLTSVATGLGSSSSGAGVYASLSAAQTDATAAAGFTILTPSATVTATDTDVVNRNGSISASLGSSGALSPSALSGVQTSLGNLSNLLSCLASSTPTCVGASHLKRISVAVVLGGTRSNVGVRKAVWMSSVLGDPVDGLL